MKFKEYRMTDIVEPEHVEILIKHDKKTIWVNVNGICILRVEQIKQLEVNDESTIKYD